MSDLRLLVCCYHLGHERVGMGNGPDQFVDAGVVARAEGRGLTVDLQEVRRGVRFEHEIGATFAVLRAHARQVAGSVADSCLPLTLGGNCSGTIGTVAGLGHQERLGVVWFDAHGDANTPETTTSGFLDGMPLAVLAGWCWRPLADSVPGFAPVPEANLMLAACRALDADEQRLLERSAVEVVPAERMRTPGGLNETFVPALDRLLSRVDRVYVHIDLDAIDLADGHANEFAAHGGPTLDALLASLDEIGDRGNVVAASLTSYNPECDEDGSALQAGLRLFDRLVEAATA